MSKNRIRLKPEERRLQILNAAVHVALKRGLYNFSIANVSRTMINCSKSTIKHYYTMESLRTAVTIEALRYGYTEKYRIVIAQAIIMCHSDIKHLTKAQRAWYLINV